MATLDESSVELGRTVKVTLRLRTLDAKNAVFRSTVVESINALREDVANLRSELGEIKRVGASVSSHRAPGKLCTLYVRVPEGGSEVSHIGKARLESLLDCEVPQYVCIKQLPPVVYNHLYWTGLVN